MKNFKKDEKESPKTNLIKSFLDITKFIKHNTYLNNLFLNILLGLVTFFNFKKYIKY